MTINVKHALDLVSKTFEIASSQQVSVAAVVTDTSGQIIASARMDGVGFVNHKVAERKALAAATFNAATHQVVEMIKDDDMLQKILFSDQNISVLPGGFTIKERDNIIGAIGIAGGMYFQDQAIGEEALA